MTKPSVESISISNVRGIVGPLTVEIPPPRDHGSLLIIHGENGSGKSSICDGLEYLLRGKLSRRTQDGVKQKRELRNLSGKEKPSLLLKLSSGDAIHAGDLFNSNLLDGEKAEFSKRSDFPALFDDSPTIIRRENIELFWKIPKIQRMDYFWDYLGEPGELVRTPQEEECLREYGRRKEVLDWSIRRMEDLFPRSEWPERFSLPTHHRRAFKAMMRAYKESSRSFKSNSDRKALAEAFENFSLALESESALRAEAGVARSKSQRDTARLEEILSEVGSEVAASFFSIYGETWISDIEFNINAYGMIDVSLKRDRGNRVSPEDILSEAGLDILSLLINIELHLKAETFGGLRVLVLDDVFQSVDTTLRTRVIEHLADRLAGWQVVISVHDRLWGHILKREFSRKKYNVVRSELRRGGYGRTPVFFTTGSGLLNDLNHAVETNASSVVIAGIVGRTLEAVMEQLSVLVGAKVARLPDDKYMLGDLLNPVAAQLENFRDPMVRASVASLPRIQNMRNTTGSHANKWAETLTETEAIDAAEIVIRLWNKFECFLCGAKAKLRKNGGVWDLTSKCDCS